MVRAWSRKHELEAKEDKEEKYSNIQKFCRDKEKNIPFHQQ